MFKNIIAGYKVLIVLVNTGRSNHYSLKIENVARELNDGRQFS